MVQIDVGNSYSRITGLSTQQEKELRKELSYIQNADSVYFGNGFAKRVSLLGKQGDFPTGLLPRVQTLFPGCKVNFTMTMPNKAYITMLNSNITPWEDQQLAITAAMYHSRGIISMPTGTGKSLVIAMLCVRFCVKTLIVVPSLEIKRQLIADISRYLTNSDFITIENIDSSALKRLTNFDMLIIDEAHHVAAKTYHKLNRKVWQGICYRFFLTATAFRNQVDEMLLFEAIAGTVIYKLDYKTAISKGYIVPIEAYYIEIDKKETSGYTYREVYNDLVINNTLAHTKIVKVLTALHTAGKSTLCLVKEVAHGNALFARSGLPFVHGNSDDRLDIHRFNSRVHKVLIGTTGVLGEGIDTKPCEYVIIAGMGKAKSAFMQNVGRAVRKYDGKRAAKVILIRYRGHKFAARHFKAQCDILKAEYGVVPIKLEIL